MRNSYTIHFDTPSFARYAGQPGFVIGLWSHSIPTKSRTFPEYIYERIRKWWLPYSIQIIIVCPRNRTIEHNGHENQMHPFLKLLGGTCPDSYRFFSFCAVLSRDFQTSARCDAGHGAKNVSSTVRSGPLGTRNISQTVAPVVFRKIRKRRCQQK